jgi:hypothetical protein
MVKLLCLNRLQDRHENPQQLFWVSEGLHIEVHCAAFRIQSVQLAPAHLARRKRWHCMWTTGSFSSDSLPLGRVKAISRLDRCRTFTRRFVKHFNACAMHPLKELLYASVDLGLRIPTCVSSILLAGRCTHLFMMFTSRARVVRSIDFMMTLFLGVKGEFASFRGLKLSTLLRILFAAIWRRWESMPRLLSVAVTSSPSLLPSDVPLILSHVSYLWSP